MPSCISYQIRGIDHALASPDRRGDSRLVRRPVVGYFEANSVVKSDGVPRPGLSARGLSGPHGAQADEGQRHREPSALAQIHQAALPVTYALGRYDNALHRALRDRKENSNT